MEKKVVKMEDILVKMEKVKMEKILALLEKIIVMIRIPTVYVCIFTSQPGKCHARRCCSEF